MEKKAMFIVDGDVFEYQGRTEVAVSNWRDGTVWVSSLERYREARTSPRHANTALLEIDGNTVVSYRHIPTIAECEESEDRWEDSFYG